MNEQLHLPWEDPTEAEAPSKVEMQLGMVQEFQEVFDTPKSKEFWLGLIKEETDELLEAVAALLKEISDYEYVCAGGHLVGLTGQDFPADFLPKFARASAYSSMIPEEIAHEAFRRVHESNMSKLGDNGLPVRRKEDGKVLKGPNYKAPDLTDLV